MVLPRTIFAIVLSLTMAFAPVASLAMAKSCTMITQMTLGNLADCPCHNSMPDCGSMPQCRTAAGCASQCFAAYGVLPSVAAQPALDHDNVKMAANAHVSSLSIEPPAPPPRA